MSTQEVFRSVTNLKQEWEVTYGNTIMLIPDIFFDKYIDLFRSLPDNFYLWSITLWAVYLTTLTSEVVDSMVSCNFIMPQLQPLTSKKKYLMHYNVLG